MANEPHFQAATPATPTTSVILPNSSTFRFPNPPFYEVARDGFKCEAWLTAVQRFFVGAKIAPEEKTLHAIIFLTGTASLWWESHPLADDTPWFAFVEAFRTEFRPVGFLDSIRSLLYSITFTSTCSEYIQRIRLYRSMIISPSMSDDARAFLDETIKTCFYKGAPTDLHQMLQGFEVSNPGNSDLQTLLSTAERFDNIYEFKPNSTTNPRSATTSQSAQKIATAPTFTQPDPYAMDLDHIALPQVLINAIAQEINRQNNNTQRNQYQPTNNQRGSRPNGNQHQWGRNNNSNTSDWAQLPRLTPAERQYLIENNGCFKCRKLGHLSYENRCPPRPTQGRGMNNIVTNAGAPFYGQSGNASSGQA
jgi:hypothetical protein